MPRRIDADDIIEKLEAKRDRWSTNNTIHRAFRGAYADSILIVRDAPAIDVEPVRHGRWIRGKNKSAFPAKPPAIWYCSYCGEMIRYNDSTGTYQKKKKKVNEVNPRCRRCGAKMDGGKK